MKTPQDMPDIDLVIPALNEAASLPLVLADLPPGWLRRIVVVDNGSSDGTDRVATALGADVVHEPRRGYGQACLAGLASLRESDAPPDIVVFLDADHSDHPEELPGLLQPILEGQADLVIGSRMLGRRERGALLPQARFGNWLAATLIRWLYEMSVTDLGPFRAIRWSSLESLDMQDTNFGWTAEMQVKAARDGLRYTERPAAYRKRVGTSKITGTLNGSVRAGYKILYTVFRHRIR